MTNSKYVPKRRFKEFESHGEWGQESLGKIVDFSIKTNSLSREKLSLESYEVQNIHYGDVLIKFDNVLDLQRDSLPSIINSKILDFKESLLQDGDLIFADAAEDSTVGKAIEIRNIGGKNVVSGLHTIAARPIQLFAPFYLGYYINSNFYHDQILPLMQGTKVSSISKSNLQVTKITFPKIDEQKELGKFFQTIDSLITLHQHKLDKLKNLKKSYLAELFPAEGQRVPKRRFPGFEGKWERRKVSELFKITRGYVLAATRTKSNKSKTTPYPVYSSQTKDKGLMGFYSKYLYEDAITWTTDGANAGEVNYREGKFYCTNVCGVLLSKEVQADPMIAEAINNIAKKYVSYVGNPKLMNNVMADIEISIPQTSSEREKISQFFTDIDKRISLQQEKLDKLKDLKKAYLNELFV